MLGCDSYTAESGTPTVKKAILDRWVQIPEIPYIVATTALAEGFDYPYVRLVLNIDEPESLVIFAQESVEQGGMDSVHIQWLSYQRLGSRKSQGMQRWMCLGRAIEMTCRFVSVMTSVRYIVTSGASCAIGHP